MAAERSVAVADLVAEFRARISELDRTILEAVNERLELVSALWEVKAEQGLPFVDPEREEALLRRLAELNPGPMSEDGLRELFEALLAITKREVGQQA